MNVAYLLKMDSEHYFEPLKNFIWTDGFKTLEWQQLTHYNFCHQGVPLYIVILCVYQNFITGQDR